MTEQGRSSSSSDTQSDWEFCQQALRDVSRTFSKPIELLPQPLCRTVTCGYLLCRVADTVEDDEGLSSTQRAELFAALVAFLHGERTSALRIYTQSFGGPSDEHLLCRSLRRVGTVLDSEPVPHRTITTRWVCEMIRGMDLYVQRDAFCARPGDLRVLLTMGDLERYCYFVAGTVGHFLTELFIDHLQLKAGDRRLRLERDAEEFALGLQLTNILKDLTDDGGRGVSYIPKSLLDSQQLQFGDLTDLSKADRTHRALAPLFERADQALRGAFRYALAIPAEASEVRLFCLLPIWMAVRTLVHARNNDAQLTPGSPVKISREEVGRLIADCHARHRDDEALRAGFELLNMLTRK